MYTIKTVLTVVLKRLRCFRDSVLAFGTQVRGFGRGRSRRIFQGKKSPQHIFLRRGIKPSVPCRIFSACKRSLKKAWKSLLWTKICRPLLACRYWELWRRCDVRYTWRCGLELRVYNKPAGSSISEGISRWDPAYYH